ncbi:MAG: FAD-linked oxidase C-terminal domain-containing protein [candidate division WOR-3 bacterium]
MDWIEKIKEEIGKESVLEEIETRKIYSRDESGIENFLCDCVVFPKNEKEIIKVLRIANEFKIPVTPRGGGTGVVGGAIPLKGGILLSLSKMNKIIDIDEKNFLIEVQPGVILKKIYEEAQKLNLFYPPDPASFENCTIGGNVATNAGGPRCIKYGVTENYVLAIEGILPSSEKIYAGKKTRKWKAGYNLPKILIGSEGTLCIFTKIFLRLLPKPEYIETLIVPFEKKEEASNSSFEMISNKIIPRCIEYVDESVFEIIGEEIRKFLPSKTRAFLLIEFDGDENEVNKNVQKTLDILNKNRAIEIYAGIKDYEREKIWKIRRDILPSLEKTGYRVRSEDVCVPLKEINNLIGIFEEMKIKFPLKICLFGHIGDGNLHINFLWKEKDIEILNKAIYELYERVVSIGGTITGEHGIGILKRKYLKIEQDERVLNLQREIKKIFDPNNILNPGKIFME